MNTTTPHHTPHIRTGLLNNLMVTRLTDFGLVLRSEDYEEVLLPNAYVTEEMKLQDIIADVFVYTDSEDRLVATTMKPSAMLGEFGFFKVVEWKSYGVFVDWGLPKDLFVPLSHLKLHCNIGDTIPLVICLDEETGRLYGSNKLGSHLNHEPKGLKHQQKVSLLVLAQTPLGYKVIVDGEYEGMVFASEVFGTISVGDKLQGYIKTIRHDGKLDIILRPLSINAKSDDASKKILLYLKNHGGTMPFTYKSDADEIANTFGISKKSYKLALTKLIEQGVIRLNDDSVIKL